MQVVVVVVALLRCWYARAAILPLAVVKSSIEVTTMTTTQRQSVPARTKYQQVGVDAHESETALVVPDDADQDIQYAAKIPTAGPGWRHELGVIWRLGWANSLNQLLQFLPGFVMLMFLQDTAELAGAGMGFMFGNGSSLWLNSGLTCISLPLVRLYWLGLAWLCALCGLQFALMQC